MSRDKRSVATQTLTGPWCVDTAAISLLMLSQGSLTLNISLQAAVVVDLFADSSSPFNFLHPELLLPVNPKNCGDAQAGKVAVYGDSNCLDSSHQRSSCYNLLIKLIQYAAEVIHLLPK